MNGQYTREDLEKAKQEVVKLLLRPNGNVVGVGIGKKEKDGEQTSEDCVRIYVVSKLYVDDLSPAALAPSSVLGVPTDVIEVQRFGRKGRQHRVGRTWVPGQDTSPRPGTPIRVKTDAPNVNSGFIGTLGAVVTDGTRNYILSCNHVMAANGRVPSDARIVSAEYVGIDEDLAAAPRSMELVSLGGDRSNSVDCALAKLPQLKQDKVQSTVRGNVALNAVSIPPEREMKIVKFGGTAAVEGTIVDVDADLYVDYSFGTFRFDHQVFIKGDQEDFAIAGDSGTIVISKKENQATAMIFAASGQFAVACPLHQVLAELGKKLNTELKLDSIRCATKAERAAEKKQAARRHSAGAMG
jgi:hypothetical protein